jgi:hypothetical protein
MQQHKFKIFLTEVNTLAGTEKKKVKKEVWNAMQGITNEKGAWYESSAMGLDPTEHHKNAAPHYSYLYDNGYGDIADAFNSANYSGALDILNQYEPENSYDEFLNSVNSAPSRQNTAGLDPTSSQWQGAAMDFLDAAKNPQISDTAQNMYNSFFATENTLNGPITTDSNGNVVSGLNIDHYNTGKGQLDYLQNFDVTKQPYFEGIMAQYNLMGGNAAQGELAGGAAGNSGNIDSFAQANANRQQLAFTSAGINQALAAANQNQQNWMSVYNRMTDHLNNMGVLNNGKLVEAGKVYAIDSAERQNALNTAAGLAQQEMQNNMQWYLDLLGYDTTIDALNREVAAQMYGVNVNADTALKQTGMETEAEKYGYTTALEGTKYAEDQELLGNLYQKDSQIDTNGNANAGDEKLTSLDIEASNAVRAWLSGAGPYMNRDAIKSSLQQKFPDIAASTIDAYITNAETAYRNNQTRDQYEAAKGIALEAVRDLGTTHSAEYIYDYIRTQYYSTYGESVNADVLSTAFNEAIAYWAQYKPTTDNNEPVDVSDEDVIEFAYKAYKGYREGTLPELDSKDAVLETIADKYGLSKDSVKVLELYNKAMSLYSK